MKVVQLHKKGLAVASLALLGLLPAVTSAQESLTVVNAASYYLPPQSTPAPIARGSLVAAFSSANMSRANQVAIRRGGGTDIICTEGNPFENPQGGCRFQKAGNTIRVNQINFYFPNVLFGTESPDILVRRVNPNNPSAAPLVIARGRVRVVPSAPGIFTANQTGTGTLSGYAIYVRATTVRYIPLSEFSRERNSFIAKQLPQADDKTSVYFVLLGTGRGAGESQLPPVAACVNGVFPSASLHFTNREMAPMPVIYYGPPGDLQPFGTDQITVNATEAVRQLSREFQFGSISTVQLRHTTCGGTVSTQQSGLLFHIGRTPATQLSTFTRSNDSSSTKKKKSKKSKKKKRK